MSPQEPLSLTFNDPEQRFLALEGARNFRDLGGYETSDGRRLKRGHLYRSDHLNELTHRDREVLGRVGLRVVCDLRTAAERTRYPDRLPPSSTLKSVHLPIHPTADNELARLLRDGRLADYEPADGEPEPDTMSVMNGFYRSFVLDHKDQWHTLFSFLVSDRGTPALVHCAGGKDRTGVACALVLCALDVPRETIIADYELTNRITGDWIVNFPGGDPPRFVRQILHARREFLLAAFAAIDEHYGSIEGYLRNGLGVNDGQVKALRRRLLE